MRVSLYVPLILTALISMAAAAHTTECLSSASAVWLRIQDHTRRGACARKVTRERSVGLPGVQETSRRRVSDRLRILRAGRFTRRLTVEP
jgi:hypothetical protein